MYGGLTIAKSTYAHSGFTLYYQTRAWVEEIGLSFKQKGGIASEIKEVIAIGETSFLNTFYLLKEIVALNKVSIAYSLSHLYKEVIGFVENFSGLSKHVFKETLYLLDGRSRLPDLLAGIGSTLYAQAKYAFSDLAPAYLYRFHAKISYLPRELIALGDDISFVDGFWRVYKEVVELADNAQKNIAKRIIEIIELAEEKKSSLIAVFKDLLALVDVKTGVIQRLVKEVIELGELAVVRQYALFKEVLELGDKVAVMFLRIFREIINFKDQIRRKLNGFYITWLKRDRTETDWVKKERPETDWTKRDRPTNFT